MPIYNVYIAYLIQLLYAFGINLFHVLYFIGFKDFLYKEI